MLFHRAARLALDMPGKPLYGAGCRTGVPIAPMHVLRAIGALAVALLVAPCASLGAVQGADEGDRPLVARCARAYAALDAAVDAAGVRDAQASRIPGAPSLRVTRFLASFAHEVGDAAAFAQWRALLEDEDRTARLFEIANLPEGPTRTVRAALDAESLGALAPQAFLEGCGRALADAAAATTQARADLVLRARVPDDYDGTARAFGLYPLTRIGFAAGVRIYEQSVRDAFVALPDAPPPSAIVYAPAVAPALSSVELGALLARSRTNPLAIPQATEVALDRLFEAHAPTFVVGTRGDFDRIGRPVHGPDGLVTTTPAPVVFARAAHTRFAGRTLLQLVYTVWFPERPPAYPGDILAGRLDGVLWRVTLDDDGAPLVFDTIHPCGCYHLFVPTARVVAKPREPSLDEQALVPATLPAVATGAEVSVHVESGTHQVRAVRIGASEVDASIRYRIARDDALRSLALPQGGARSLYGPDGLVPGTGRGEALLYWPLGIRDAGAMRQWGRHATAFVGRRHFDEAWLLDRYFALAAR
jgi:hypothetical protein